MASAVVPTAKLSSCVLAARSAPVVLVAVSVTALVLGSVLMALSVMPVAAVRAPATKPAKSRPSVAVPLAVSREKVTLRPAPRPKPSRTTE